MAWAQQRQHPRYKVALPIELRAAGATSPLRAQTGDICLGGCYVEMTSTQKIAREVEITIWVGQEKVQAHGVVVSNHPSFGNGIKFTQVPDDSKERLQQLLQSLDPFAGQRIMR